jgi:hypothetical protein
VSAAPDDSTLRSYTAILYNGDADLRNQANTVFDAINQAGDIAG